MVAGRIRARGKSELHRARVPGESQGGAGNGVDSPDWRAGQPRESNRNQSGRLRAHRLKRAILPAAISESGRYQVARQGRKSRAVVEARRLAGPVRTERDDHQEQNSAYSPSPCPSLMVPLAQSAERLSVEQEVTGSSPVRHPPHMAR